MYRFISQVIVATILFLCVSLSSSAHDCPWDPNLIEPIPPIQDTAHMMASIPPELQNLPYAIYPNSPEYNTYRLNFNKRFVYFPRAIIVPETNQQIQYVLGVIIDYNLSFSIRSGGHCFEPGSLSSDYIIDLRNFNSIIPDVTHEQVYIGAGCVLGTVIDTLGQIDYAIPTGTCPTVGVTGLTLGGGIGLLDRNFGLTCDSVISITFLNANAEIIEVNESSYPDLFWALLGGGNGSYGIVLGFTFKMYYIPTATFYELIWEWDPKLVSPLMYQWQKWVATLPDNITSVFGIRHPNTICAEPQNTPPLVIRIFGLKVGSEPFTEWTCPFSKFNPQVKIFQDRYVNTAKYWANESLFPFNKAKSNILKKPVSKKVMKMVTRFFKELDKKNPDYLVYFNFEAFGGKIPSLRHPSILEMLLDGGFKPIIGNTRNKTLKCWLSAINSIRAYHPKFLAIVTQT